VHPTQAWVLRNPAYNVGIVKNDDIRFDIIIVESKNKKSHGLNQGISCRDFLDPRFLVSFQLYLERQTCKTENPKTEKK